MTRRAYLIHAALLLEVFDVGADLIHLLLLGTLDAVSGACLLGFRV
jgi:hypothetical protein